MNKGEFLREKLENMAKWVTTEVGKENLAVDIITAINGRSVVEIAAFCGILDANSDRITTRNWSGLVQLMTKQNLGQELQQVVVAVQQRPAMHDKFWRYMDMFIEVTRQ